MIDRSCKLTLFALLTLAACGLAALGGAGSAQNNVVNSPETAVAIVLGMPILAGDLQFDATDKTDLRDYRAISGPIASPLISKYIKDHRLGATDAEIKEFQAWMSAIMKQQGEPLSMELSPADVQASEDVARFSIEKWKFERALFEHYGGRIVFQQAGLEPLDAYRDWLQDQQRAGNFEIYDPKWNDAFWEYFKPRYHQSRFLEERDAFKVPPWQTASPADQ